MKIEPGLDIKIVGEIYYPKDAHQYPGSLIDNLKSIIRKRGIWFSYNTSVTDIKTDCDKIEAVTTEVGQIFTGGTFINCAGAESSSLMNMINIKLLLPAGKRYSITLENPAVLPDYCGILSKMKVTLTPMYNSLRFAGTMEIMTLIKNGIEDWNFADYVYND